MLAIFDLDVRALAAGGSAPAADFGRAGLARIGSFARFAALLGIDAVGVVERFSAMHGPGVLQALQGAARADEGLIAWEHAARVLPGGAVRTDEGIEAVAFGPPRALLGLAGAFQTSLFRGFRPRLVDVSREAHGRGLLLLARADEHSREVLAALDRRTGGVDGLLAGPAEPVFRPFARTLGRSVAGGSGARRRPDLGARRTAIALDAWTFAEVRRAFAEGAVTSMGACGALQRTVVRGAAAVEALLASVRGAVGVG
jgi:hypothetical protein